MSEQPKAEFNEENVIDQVYQHPCLYDTNAEGYKDPPRRNKAWDEIGQHMNVKGELAKESWEKLRRCFMNAIKRRKTKQLHPWRFEEQMSFLYHYIDPAKKYGKHESSEQPYYSETDDSRLADELETSAFSVYEDSLAGEVSEISSSIKREENSDGYSRMERDRNQLLMEFPRPMAISNCSTNDNGTNKGKRPLSVDPQMEPLDTEEYNTEFEQENLSRRAKKQRRKSRYASVDNESSLSSNDTDKDDIDLFFHSMAKTTKTLTAIDQAKIKLQISQIVLGAQIVMLQQDSK